MARLRFYSAFLLVLAATFTISPAHAQDAIMASEVSVDITGKDATDARLQAMARAEQDGFKALMQRIAPEQAQSAVAALKPEQISAMSKGVEVVEEKITANRYRAKLRVSFSSDQIAKLLGKISSATPDVATVSTATLVIPAYEDKGATVLWEDTNAWRGIWSQVGLESRQGNIIVPYGDAADMETVNGRTITAATYSGLSRLVERYGAQDIAIVLGRYNETDQSLTVVVRMVGPRQNEVTSQIYNTDAGEDQKILMTRAVRDIAEQITRKKAEAREAITHAAGVQGRVMVLVPVNTLTSWTDVRKKLQSLPLVDSLEVLAMSPQQVDLIVHYRGGQEALAGGITQQGLRLIKTTNYWVVSRE